MDNKIFRCLVVNLVLCFFTLPVTAQRTSPTAPALVDEITDAVRWNAWTEQSFEEARRSEKPVFLSIEARWQYASEVLRIAAYQNQKLASRINRLTTPVRVDADQRPDIVRRYAPEGLPTVVILNQEGYPFFADNNRGYLGGKVKDPTAVNELLDPFMKNRNWKERAVDRGESWSPKPPAEELFTPRYVELVRLDISRTFDEKFGGYGNPDEGFSPKEAPINTLRFLLETSLLLGKEEYLEPVELTLQNMIGSGQYYYQGFPEQSISRTWLRMAGENTLDTNMGLLELYLKTFKYTGKDRYMETVYRLQEDTEHFQDIFLRKGFSGAFYSAQRALTPPDEMRGLEEGPMIQSLLSPSVAQAIKSYYLLTELTNENKWKNTAVKATDFLLTEMVQPDGRTLYSLDRDGPGKDTIFSAYPNLANALLETYQQTSDKRYLKMAITVMGAAHLRFWNDAGYYEDIDLSVENIGLLKRERLDLDGNARAADVWMKLGALEDYSLYRDRARKVLETLSGEAIDRGHEAAEFTRVMVHSMRPMIAAYVVGSPTHTTTLALRDACLRAKDPWTVVQVVDPATELDRVEDFYLPDQERPTLYLFADLVKVEPVTDPKKVDEAVAELKSKLK